MFRKFLFGAIGVVALVFLVGLLLPGDWEIQASASIAAPPAKICADVATPRTWREWHAAWSPDKDPDCDHTYTGPRTGVGAT
jgi:hypothetical protein